MYTKTATSREDEYFARVEYERRRKIAEEHAAKLKKRELSNLKKLHWMRCPKDGLELVEIEHRGIRVDKCTHCGGIYLDQGELDLLLAAGKDEEGLVGKILKAFK